ncbi:MAG: hypothetical protein JJU28_02675 [Cyclobacteriaceae bacterium]|nr:hypothetical protein [Cyclobacteriaceae bacterium]
MSYKKNIFKWIGIVLICLLFGAGLIFIRALNYPKYDVKGDKAHLSGDGPADYDLLASRLLSEMRLEEKLAQMYGERRFMGFAKFISSSF